MDPVTKILVDRESTRPRLLPWVVLAIVMHAGMAAATYLVGRRAASRPIQLPVVSVKIVRQQGPSRRPPSRQTEQRATAVPQPTEAPPTAVPEPEPEPEPIPTAPPRDVPQASAEAMRAADAAATPQPTPPPVDAGGAGGRGLSIGENAAAGAPGIPADFHFTYYVERMLALIESRWYKPSVPAGTRARVRFVILKSGRIEGIQLEESSGISSFDRAALRAMYAANPLPPLPPAYRKPSLTIHLSFAE
jgi:TonB family protein